MTKSQYEAVQQVIRYLKENSNFRGLFVNYGSRIRVKKIVTKIEKGDKTIGQFLRLYSSPRESATALNLFLQDIGKPIISKRAQALILANNYGVCSRVVAMDALSLLYENLKGPHRLLFISLMIMMKKLSTTGSLRPTELRVSHAPYLLMPLLFSVTKEVTQNISKNWKSIADILNEMVLNFDIFLNGAHFYPKGSIYTAASRDENEPQLGTNERGNRRTTYHNQLNSSIIRNFGNDFDPSYYIRFDQLFI